MVVLDKRFQVNSDYWLSRGMVVQFHKKLLSLQTDIEYLTKCPSGVCKEKSEVHRQKYDGLTHMSIKNIQLALQKKLKEEYPKNFFMLELTNIRKDGEDIILTVKNNDSDIHINNINQIIDATGYHSVLMNGLLQTEFDGNIEYGYALKVTWPEHLVEGVVSRKSYKDVLAFAVGDSLASTDFRHGLGVNRGVHTATRILRDNIDPETARLELIENGYFPLTDYSDKNIFDRAVFCRDWLLSEKENRR